MTARLEHARTVLKSKPQQPAEAVAVELWCLHLQGPDDVYAAPSKTEAERAAKAVNERFADSPVAPNAVAAPWPHSPSSHSDSLKDWQAEWGVVSPAASIWIQFSEDGINIRFWTRDQNRAVEESFCHARPLTAYYLTPPPAIDIGKLRELYDAAGKGFHISETCGQDGKYWYVSKFPDMASLHAFVDAWTAVMRDMRDAK